MEHKYAIVVAGGKGTRFSNDQPKQFIELEGKPVLIHTLEKFVATSRDIRIIVVLPKEDMGRWAQLQQRYPTISTVESCTGGATRMESVRNGLARIDTDGWVAIHDGVRPLTSPKLIAASYAEAQQHGSAVPAVAMKDSLRKISAGGDTVAVDRSHFRLVQTPQTFRVSEIQRAYALASGGTATDDATVAEQAGMAIHLFEGHYDNIKITTPDDLVLARALMRNLQ